MPSDKHGATRRNHGSSLCNDLITDQMIRLTLSHRDNGRRSSSSICFVLLYVYRNAVFRAPTRFFEPVSHGGHGGHGEHVFTGIVPVTRLSVPNVNLLLNKSFRCDSVAVIIGIASILNAERSKNLPTTQFCLRLIINTHSANWTVEKQKRLPARRQPRGGKNTCFN
jgi:hypothetical protein